MIPVSALTVLVQAVKALRKLPPYVWLLAGLTLAVVGACWERGRYGAAQYEAGRRNVTQGARFDSVIVDMARAADSVAQSHTDTLVQRVVVTRWRVDSVIQRVPDSVKALPEVWALIGTTQTLTRQVDSLVVAIDAERATGRMRASVDSAAIAALRIITVAQRDTIQTLAKRPKWRHVAGAVVVGALVGVMGGRR